MTRSIDLKREGLGKCPDNIETCKARAPHMYVAERSGMVIFVREYANLRFFSFLREGLGHHPSQAL